MLENNTSISEKGATSGLSAFEDARTLVRLIQCSACSRPYRAPITLPCGNSICKQCLPESFVREGIISYPDLPDRRKALQCPFTSCGDEHPLSECCIDVTLTKVMDAIDGVVNRHIALATDIMTIIEEPIQPAVDSTEKSTVHELPGGRLAATYMLAKQGQLLYNIDLEYPSIGDSDEAERNADLHLLSAIADVTNREVDCQVCYALMIEPVTTHCGHTLCRSCMARVMDYSTDCPVCRRSLALPQKLSRQANNRTLSNLLDAVCPEAVAARKEILAGEAQTGEPGRNVALFVCTLAFPGHPTFLRIFEPRYKLMLRRCLEGDRQFGMLMYNRYLEPQGDLGPVHFYHYGTMLEIVQAQSLPDGTSMVETKATYRFRVTAHSVIDGYAIGDVEKIEDVPVTEEERIESEETARTPLEDANAVTELDHMSTQALFELGKQFVQRMETTSAVWLQQRILDIHGQPPEDAALFPYWFASVLPISEEEKYRLLGTTTVRERLKITASWIRRIEAQRWYRNNPCRIL